MQTKRNFTVVLTAVLAIVALGIAAPAAQGATTPPAPVAPPTPPTPPAPIESGLIGTWYGQANSSMMWLGIQTAGSTGAQDGEMLLNFVHVSPELLTVYTANSTYSASYMSPGHGVWQEISPGKYTYTWYAYGIGSSGSPVFSIRVKGTATNTDSNDVVINYTYDVFAGWVLPQCMATATQCISPATPIAGYPYPIIGIAEETRVPLVTP